MEPGADQTTETSRSSQIKVKQMPAKKLAVTAACLRMLLISGCMGKVRYPSHYTLSIAPPTGPDPRAPYWKGSVAVRRFETPMYPRQGRIVYRESPDQIGFYDYHRWAADSGATVTAALSSRFGSRTRSRLSRPTTVRTAPTTSLLDGSRGSTKSTTAAGSG